MAVSAEALLLQEAVARGAGQDTRLDGMGPDERGDGWNNEVVGLGTARDKQQHWNFDGVPLHEDELFSALFAKDTLVRKGMATIPEEALRKGWTLTLDPEFKEHTKEVRDLLDSLKVEDRLVEGWTMGRTFGGCAVIMGVDDGRDPSKPLNLESVKGLNFLNVLDRRYLQVAKVFNDPLGPNWGEPEIYKIQSVQHLSAPDNDMKSSSTDALGKEVHASRVLIFEGAPTTLDTRQQLQLWWQSEVDLILEDVRDFQSNWKAIGYLISESSVGVYEYKNLLSLMASGKIEQVLKRLEMLDRAKSTARSVVIDKDTEGYSKVSESFTGVPELIDRLAQRVSGALGIPITLLFGRSAAGENSTGDSDFRQFYDRVDSARRKKLKPKLELLVHIALLVLGIDPEKANPEIGFPKLWELTELEQADVELKTSQKDVGYINAGVAAPEEIALTRWDEEGNFQTATVLAQDLRKELLEAEQKVLEEKIAAGEIGAEPAPAEPEPPRGQETGEDAAQEKGSTGDAEGETDEEDEDGEPVNS